VLPGISADQASYADVAVWLDWDSYLGWLAGKVTHTWASWGERVPLGPPWQPGEHMCLIGPTGDGKTTHALGVLGLRKWVLALDPKGEDETLSASGYVRVRSLPATGWRALSHARTADQQAWRDVHKRIDAGQPARVLVGGGARTEQEDTALQDLMRSSITYCRHAGGWCLYVDEFELLSSVRMFGLGPAIERMLITARRDKTSVVTSYQAQAWVSRHAIRQARRAVIWPTGDRDMITEVSRGIGRDRNSVGQAVDRLPPFHTLTIPRGPRWPMVITLAPKVA
jgi:hypothetical protein